MIWREDGRAAKPTVRSSLFRIERSDDGTTWTALFDAQSSNRFVELQPFKL